MIIAQQRTRRRRGQLDLREAVRDHETLKRPAARPWSQGGGLALVGAAAAARVHVVRGGYGLRARARTGTASRTGGAPAGLVPSPRNNSRRATGQPSPRARADCRLARRSKQAAATALLPAAHHPARRVPSPRLLTDPSSDFPAAGLRVPPAFLCSCPCPAGPGRLDVDGVVARALSTTKGGQAWRGRSSHGRRTVNMHGVQRSQ